MIYIIRHGQTEVNHRQALQGRSDFPLNDAGILQVQRAAEGMNGKDVCLSEGGRNGLSMTMELRDSGTGYVVTIWTIYHVRRRKISIFSVTEKDSDKAFAITKARLYVRRG